MKAERRASLACVCATIVHNSLEYRAVYDYERSKYSYFSTSGSIRQFTIYDYDRSCYMSINTSSCYDYGTSSYVTINRNGNMIILYDHQSMSLANISILS